MPKTWVLGALLLKQVQYTVTTLFAFGVVFTLFELQSKHNQGLQSSRDRWQGVSSSPAGEGFLKAVFNATIGFERILAINAPEQTELRDGQVLAAAISGVKIEFVDGVHGGSISDKALPGKVANNLTNAHKGAWRAQINAISRVVERGWTSALIMEYDVASSIHIRRQLRSIVSASEYVTRTKELNSVVQMADINARTTFKVLSLGDRWDVLWFRDCEINGVNFPSTSQSTAVLIENGVTIPETEHYAPPPEKISPLQANFAHHSRTIKQHHPRTCSLAYAVSQQGARKLLFSLGLCRLDKAFDLMLTEWCQGTNGHERHVCIRI